MRALSAARNFRLRAEIRNGEMVTQTRRSPDNSAPRRLPPGSSRLQANKHPAGAGSPEARCFGRGSSEKRTASRRSNLAASASPASRMFSGSLARFRQLAGCAADTAAATDVRVQAAASPSSKRRTLRISGSIFSLRKLGACSGHCTVQRMPLTRLVSWARYHAAIPISTNKSQQSAAATYGLLTTRLRARLRRGELTSDF